MCVCVCVCVFHESIHLNYPAPAGITNNTPLKTPPTNTAALTALQCATMESKSLVLALSVVLRQTTPEGTGCQLSHSGTRAGILTHARNHIRTRSHITPAPVPASVPAQHTAAMEAARLEEEFQMEQWGLVEGGHDLDRAATKVTGRAGERGWGPCSCF